MTFDRVKRHRLTDKTAHYYWT